MKHLPITIKGEKVYASFWRRFGAIWIDFLMFLPIIFLLHFLNNLHRNVSFFTVIASTLIFWFYRIYFHARWGATIGKMVTRVKVVKTDGNPIGYKEALLRFAVDGILGILMIIAHHIALLDISVEEFAALELSDRAMRIYELYPSWHKSVQIAMQVWMWSEFFVLLLNKRKRALHDFIAGTVVIKKKFEYIAEQILPADAQ